MENLEQMEKALQNTTQILEETNQIDWTGILNLIHLTDMEKMLVEQYKNGENLNIRISLHEQYSQNKKGWFPWLLEHSGDRLRKRAALEKSGAIRAERKVYLSV